MAIKRYKPTSSARRFMTVSAYDEITKSTPERSLLEDQRNPAEETLKVRSPFVTSAAATEENTVSSTLRERKTAFPQR